MDALAVRRLHSASPGVWLAELLGATPPVTASTTHVPNMNRKEGAFDAMRGQRLKGDQLMMLK